MDATGFVSPEFKSRYDINGQLLRLINDPHTPYRVVNAKVLLALIRLPKVYNQTVLQSNKKNIDTCGYGNGLARNLIWGFQAICGTAYSYEGATLGGFLEADAIGANEQRHDFDSAHVVAVTDKMTSRLGTSPQVPSPQSPVPNS
jgi:hypothetical protein